MSVPSMTRIITRKSQLALWQANWVKNQAHQTSPGLNSQDHRYRQPQGYR